MVLKRSEVGMKTDVKGNFVVLYVMVVGVGGDVGAPPWLFGEKDTSLIS
jgi:hypothetical protein